MSDGTTNASLRRGDDPEELTLERALELISDRRAAGPAERGTRKPAGTTKKAGARKATASKKPAARKTTARKATALARSGVALRIGVEHVLQLHGGDVMHRLEADDGARNARLPGDLGRALGDIFREVANPLDIGGNADRADDLAQVDRQRLPRGDGAHGVILDRSLQRVEARSRRR